MTEASGRMTVTVKQKFDLRKYSRLVSKVAPLVIETKEEFERADAEIGRLLKKGYDNLSVEERRLLALLSRAVQHLHNDPDQGRVALRPYCRQRRIHLECRFVISDPLDERLLVFHARDQSRRTRVAAHDVGVVRDVSDHFG